MRLQFRCVPGFTFAKSPCLSLCVAFALCSPSAPAAEPLAFDVVIYGGTPGGIAAAIAAGQQQRSVLLVEPTARIGGLVTSGLSHTDFHSLESLTGTFLDFTRRVEQHYTQEYGAGSQQVETTFHGTFGEPKVNLQILEEMLREHPHITVQRHWRLVRVDTATSTTTAPAAAGSRRQISAVEFRDNTNAIHKARGQVFIDGTYEGDLMAAAGVDWKAGREGRKEYQESLAPEQGDEQLQAYNFRFIMTPRAENRVTPVAPPGYRREDFVGVLEPLKSGKIKKIFDYPANCIFKAQTPPLPNDKYDINDVSRGLVRLSLPGKNLGWPNGTFEDRAAIFAEHVRDQVGLLYFLQNDDAVPAHFREEAREWGWCRDEFGDTQHLPPQLYVREARRMVGQHVFTQQDSERAANEVRAVWHRDAIAMGDYGNNCHGTSHTGTRFGGQHAGEFYNAVPPYQIPYGVLVPKDVDNLLVPVAASSTHVGFCALRLEPIWTSLGQAAGQAAALAVKEQIPVQQVPVPQLQRELHQRGSATIYVSDVLPGHVDFAAVQWWGTAGGLHGLVTDPVKVPVRGKRLHGQYSEAPPEHAAALDTPLTPELRANWLKLSGELRLDTSLLKADSIVTRGDFVRAAWRLAVQ